MKKWALAITVAFFAVASVAAGAVALSDDGGAGGGERIARDADGAGGEAGGDGADGGGGVAGICLEGAVDCNDTPIEPPPDNEVCIQIFPTPPECADPDAPVSNNPVVVVPPDPGACEVVHSEECGKIAVGITMDGLARRLGSPAGITLVSVEPLSWPNACLGVSQPDVGCAEVITAGFRILLEANGQTYEYHTDGGSRAVLVE
jgi:hypothetical protein